MSPLAYKLFIYLRRQEIGELVMEEMMVDLRSSRTAIRTAFEELRIEGLVAINQEV